MKAPRRVLQLVGQFERNRDAYRSGQYNETQVRHEFIDPLFMALGWDVNNEQGYAEAYKDVIHEDAIKVGGATKAPDYCFRVGGTRKFFLEAKKPSVHLKGDISAAFQLRRYAWSAKLPLSVLTDFEEFAVYDCRVRPVKTDRASTARVMYRQFTDYAERWDEIASVFSRDAVLKGSFDKYADTGKRKKGTAEVDAAFLKEIETWRDVLARNFALRNPGLSQRELNFAVQRTIDRIIFLRMCEDRGIETYGRLMALQSGPDTYRRLAELFQRADERYNSGLFHFEPERARPDPPDELTLALALDDKALKDILADLYYPESPYEFSVLPADILGQVYEQFLGKVIRLTPGHRAVVEDKPEVKKAGGVYYTPTYIVDYIVEHTVGKLLEGKTPREVRGPVRRRKTKAARTRGAQPLRVLDPACGSGSFLIAAYQHLLDWYRDQYETDGPEKHRDELYQGRGGAWRLTTAERKRILLDHIYGVDIDPQAVEVTKLSLLLKVLEGESGESLQRQLRLFHERALPDLGSNIKCGNSLIGPDFYEGKQMSFLDEDERLRINVFDWPAEFAGVFGGNNAGFDGVIGNPPYIFSRDKGFSSYEKTYFKKRFTRQSYQLHSFTLFLERAWYLLTQKGTLGFIIPNNWLSIPTMKCFRDFIVGHTGDLKIVNNTFKVFVGANVDTAIVFFRKVEPGEVELAQSSTPGEIDHIATIDARTVLADPIIQFRLYSNPPARLLLQKLQLRAIALGQVATVKAGLKAYETGKGHPKQTDTMKKNRVYHARDRLDPRYRVYLDGEDVRRYCIRWSGQYLRYGANLAAPRDPSLFQGQRILVRQIPSRPPYSINGAIVSGEEVNDINSMIVRVSGSYSLTYILGLLNSRLLTFWFDYTYDKFQRGIFPQFKVMELASFPIRAIDFADRAENGRHARLGELVDQMLGLQRQVQAVRTPHEHAGMQRQIAATDREIDRLVYELYGLTDAEIAIVEGATQG